MASAERTETRTRQPSGGVPADRRGLRLRRIAPYVPSTTVAIADLQERIGLSRAEVRLYTSFLGLERVPRVEDMTALEMMLMVGEAVLDGVDRTRVRHLVHPHTVLHVAPATHRLMTTLRDKLQLPEASGFELTHQHCTSGLFALRVIEALLRTEPPGAQALVLVTDRITTSLVQRLPGTTVFGEAAVAVLAGLDGPGDEVLGQAHRTLGEYHLSLDMPADVQRRYKLAYMPTMLEVLHEAVADAGLTLDDVDRILPHNVNMHSWVMAAKSLGVPVERFYLENVPKTGHCFCADPFVNLHTARAESAVRPGDVVAMLSAGSSGTFSAVLVRVDDLPGAPDPGDDS